MGRMTTMWAVIALVLAAGCLEPERVEPVAVAAAATAGDGHDQLVPPQDGMESQGQHLLGEWLDGAPAPDRPLAHLSWTTRARDAAGRPITVTFEGSAALRSGDHRGADRYFDGVVLAGASGGELRLTVSRGGYDLAFYRLEVRPRPSEPWSDPCLGGEAVPFAGYWQRSGLHVADPSRISFACAGAVGYKCSVWGYLAGGDPGGRGWRSHQACTRMARGDYCSNGRSHTREGTQIRITDFVGVTSKPPARFEGVASWPPPPTKLYFEAAWNDGVTPASCLSRLRWQSLPLGPLCDDGSLPDPRLDTSVKFCEDLEWTPPTDGGTQALLFDESFYSDLSLHLWRDGDDLVTTVRGYYEQPLVRVPFADAGDYVHVAPDGLLLRVLRPGVDPAEFEEIHLYRSGSDRVIAGISQPPPDYEDVGFEGYVRRSPGGPLVPFRMFVNPSTRDLLSTVGPAPAGYQPLWTIGYTLPGETR